MLKLRMFAAGTLLLGLGAASSCGGGGGGGAQTPGGPSPGPGSSQPVTITIRADGTVDPQEVRIDIGQAVRFVNSDTRAHEPTSNPHLVHTDCPQINNVRILQPGENRMTDAFSQERVCGFHDHMNPDTTALRGTIRVAGAEGPAGPVYIKP